MGAGTAFTKEGALVRTKRTWVFVATIMFAVLGFTPAILAVLGAVSGALHYAVWLGVILYYAGLGGGMSAWNRWWQEQRGGLRADETGLWRGERCLVRRGEVRHGYVLRRGERVYVRLGRMVRQVEVEVADEAEGQALLVAMRLDAARSVAQYPMTHGTWRGSLLRAGLSILAMGFAPLLAEMLGGTLPVFIGSLFVVATLVCLHAFNQMVRVSVGADGVRVRRLLQRARFVPFSAIDDAVTDGRNITIRLARGEEISLHHPGGRVWSPIRGVNALSDHALEGRKLVERIKEQVAAHRARTAADPAVFARSGRKTAQWVRDMVGAADVNASYRSPAVPPDELWRIVEDAAAPATARAGAAVALRGALDDEGRVRLRATADACAAPRLRVALETVASGEDDEGVCEALEPLEDRVGARRVRQI